MDPRKIIPHHAAAIQKLRKLAVDSRLMHKFAIAILTFNPACVFGNLQPNPGMAERASTVTGNPPLIHDLGFWGASRHRWCHVIASGLGAR
ncbi:hypothetical protein OAN307_c06620 [Octadecabacter antarcticus 307]|uniref:Uncharacterized protein n=1 Tax=Octadecabacter antarcticus 307 TaxID=391626 RepID=M9R167_9RHOB|nr:hypothetical protein OAN307_c06620 [Octadecabacter antarcticus 307]